MRCRRLLAILAFGMRTLGGETLPSGGAPGPVILDEPQSLSVLRGGTATLAVLARGTPPLTYQWRLNGTNILSSTISTVAGNGTTNYTGDGGTALEAGLSPLGIAVDATGNLFITDPWHHVLRKVDTNGIATTIAGTGQPGASGDGGPALKAQLNEPFGIRVDAAGNVYFADSGNHRVRKVDANGVITTVAGDAIHSGLNYPLDVALDSLGNLYIADMGNSRVAKVDAQGLVTTVGGSGEGALLSLWYVSSVAVDSLDNLLIADEVLGVVTEGPTSRISKMDNHGVVSRFLGPRFSLDLGNGITRSDALDAPSGVAVDPDGNVYVVERDSGRILKVDSQGIVSTVAGDQTQNRGFSGDGGLATRAGLSRPFMAAVDSQGQLFFSDSDNNRVRKVLLRGSPRLPIPGESASAGEYSVVVSDRFGSVTSRVATVKVVLPRLDAKFTAGRLTIQCADAPGTTHVLEAASVMGTPMDWVPISTNTTDASGRWVYSGPDDPGIRERYYRLTHR